MEEKGGGSVGCNGVAAAQLLHRSRETNSRAIDLAVFGRSRINDYVHRTLLSPIRDKLHLNCITTCPSTTLQGDKYNNVVGSRTRSPQLAAPETRSHDQIDKRKGNSLSS